MSIEKERKTFEEWAYSNKWNICRYPKSDYHMKEGQYCDEFVDGAWHGWIKSANRGGYKLVPVVDTDAMWSAGRAVIEDYGYSADASDVYKAMIGAVE